jgi:hypothetical protein
MKSRAARLSLLILFVVAFGVTAYLFWTTESGERAQATAREAFATEARMAARQVVELRAAQQAYVAVGQDRTFWFSRVESLLSSVKPSMDSLRRAALSTDARTEIDTAATALQDFEQMDNRARDFARRDETDRAADLIFSSGAELSEAAVTALDSAATLESALRSTEAGTYARRQLFALAAGAGAAVLVLLLLMPMTSAPVMVSTLRREPAIASPVVRRSAGSHEPEQEGWTNARRATDSAAAALEPDVLQAPAAGVPDLSLAVPEVAEPMAAEATAAPMPDFGPVASLCTDLSRIDDTMALPPLLERAAAVLDAVGIILWIADPDGRELNPVLAQGYPQHLVMRLGTIPRHAENATAAAFRTALIQTVDSDGLSNGAIAAPLLTCGGCVGVMAAEVRGDFPGESHRLAAAAIIAAQLASLVGPPAARTEVRAEAAGA